MGKKFYFEKFEQRKPYPSIPDSRPRTFLFQFSGILTILLGLAYLHWRWRYSMNYDALWFAIPLVIAETLSFTSTILVIINFWNYKKTSVTAPVHYLSEIENLHGRPDRPISIDVFIATYNEDVDLVRFSIRDAKKMRYPYDDAPVKVYVLDDGRRDGRDPAKQNMKRVAEEEGVEYLIREHNKGYKAGNLKNGLEQTNGDLFVILDADTRPFPDFLLNTTGYFKNRKLAWVQTPQWFYDTTEPESLSSVINSKFNIKKASLKKINEFLFGKFKVNEDVFGNDPRLFYDVILRKRNYYNAAFCCGAGSVHRREAVMSLAVKDFGKDLMKFKKELNKKNLDNDVIRQKAAELVKEKELIPFKFHASEDIYTSIMLHADSENRWESVQHPNVECKMLSTQDLDSWIKQHARYAAGSLDIAFKDNPLMIKGLTIGQKISYFTTIWSYFAPLWLIVFLISPIIFFFTLILPVQGYSFDFFKYFIPFQIMNTLTITLGCWGIKTKRGDQYYIAGFWYMLVSLITVIRGKEVKFNVTPKNKTISKNTQHIMPHIIIMTLSVIGILYNVILLLTGYHPTASGFAANAFWCLYNFSALSIMIRAAKWKPLEEDEEESEPEESVQSAVQVNSSKNGKV